MLSNAELIKSLDELDRLFQLSPTSRDSMMHAKHALLELCGWIEEAEDYILQRCADKILDATLKSHVADRIKKNSSFHFSNSFVPLLALVIGLTKYELIQNKLTATATYFSPLISIINALKDPRNSHAHTHFEAAKSCNPFLLTHAPSFLKQKAIDIHLGFLEFERCLKKHRLMK